MTGTGQGGAPPDFGARGWRLVAERPITATLALLALVSLVFLLAPAIDDAVSGLFYEPGIGFPFRRHGPVESLRHAGELFEWLLGIAVLAPFLIKLWFPDSRLLVKPRHALFLVGSFLAGPVLLVNVILKAHWGRARPWQAIEFGGHMAYSPVWWISDQCARNCSFVSGEAASAFWVVAFAFVAPKAWRGRAAVAAILFAAIISATRLAAGGHFLSDVLIAWLLTLLVILALWRLVLQGLPASFDRAVEARIEAAGLAIRRLFGGFRRAAP